MGTNNKFGPNGWTPERLHSLSGKTYVITGANTGTGFEATRILLSKGASVVMLNRNSSKSRAAVDTLKQSLGRNTDITFICMDLGDLNSVRKAAMTVLENVTHIDALICNAAIAQVSKQTFTKDGFESHLGINHYGHFLLCGLLFNRINDSGGRIVVVASEGYKMGLKSIQFEDMNWDKNYDPNSTYCHSKLAQMMVAYELHHRIKERTDRANVYVCHPGASKTSLIDKKASLITRIIFSLMAMSPMVQSAEKGAYPEVMCATEDNLEPQAYYGPSGRMNWVGPVGECGLEPFVLNRVAAAKLWTISEKMTGFRWF